MGSDIFNYSGRFFLSFGESMMIIFVPYVTYNDKAPSGFKNVISDKDQSTSPDQVCFDRQMVNQPINSRNLAIGLLL
jgi:hypothetical protein